MHYVENSLTHQDNLRNGCQLDLILYNGNVVTVDDDFRLAQAAAISRGRIVDVGTTEAILGLAGRRTALLNLDGNTVVPGIQDSHIHFLDLGWNLMTKIDLSAARSVEDILTLVHQAASKAAPGEWVEGFGWDWVKLEEKRMANRLELDAVAPQNPVYLAYIEDGCALNSVAMRENGIDSGWEWWRKDPPWTDELNYIERFHDGPHAGEPTGVFWGKRGLELINCRKALPGVNENVAGIEVAQEAMLSCGVTAVVDPFVSDLRAYQAAYTAGKLKLRVTAYLDLGGFGSAEDVGNRVRHLMISNLGDAWFRIRGAKFFADGGIGSLDAAVSEPYVFGKPGNYGELVQPDGVRYAQYKEAVNYGWELHTHCAGDRGLAQTLMLYEKIMKEIKPGAPCSDLRYSAIHSFLPMEPQNACIEAMARLGVVATVNPAFYYDLGDSFHKFIGDDRMARFIPLRSMMERGVVVACGSDYPFATYDPWVGMFAAVVRKTRYSRRVFGERERITIPEALRMYTIGGAYLTHSEKERGSIEPGKLADLVVLDKDVLTMDPEELESMRDHVLMTFVEGRIAWRSDRCGLGLSKPSL